MEPLLAIEDVRVSFEKESGAVAVLNGVDLNVQPGESISIVGESGAGKTVLVRTILNLLQEPWKVRQGRIRFDGEDLLTKQEDELRQIRGVKIALTSPEPRKQLNPLVRIGEQLAHGIRAHRKITRKEALGLAVEALEAVGNPRPAFARPLLPSRALGRYVPARRHRHGAEPFAPSCCSRTSRRQGST